MRYLLLSLIFTISLVHSSNAAPGDTYLCEVTQWFENRPTQYKELAKDIFELQKHDPPGKVFLFKWTEDNFLNFIDKGSYEQSFKHFVNIRMNDKIKITPAKRDRIGSLLTILVPSITLVFHSLFREKHFNMF